MSLSEALAGVDAELSSVDPSCLSLDDARRVSGWLASHVKRVEAFQARVAARVSECEGAGAVARIARQAGKTTGQVRCEIDTVTAASDIPVLAGALGRGEVSLAQGAEIAKTEAAVPGSAERLVETARREGLSRVRDEGRRIRQAAMDDTELHARRRTARSLRWFCDDLGMVNLHARLVPEVGMRLVNRLERRAQRRWLDGERHSTIDQRLADALVDVALDDTPTPGGKPELVVVAHLDALTRGFATPGEACHIAGGPRLSMEAVKHLARQALLTVVLDDGVKIDTISRYTRHIPAALRVLLEIGEPPGYLEAVCIDCANRFRLQLDHLDPLANGGATTYTNLAPRCPPCHSAKTAHDRRAGLLNGTNNTKAATHHPPAGPAPP